MFRLSACACALGLLLTIQTNRVIAAPPNILFILSDDHSVPFLGCYGHKTVKTPNLDRFAAEGARFNKAFTVAPQCVPSRAGYLTGRSAVSVRMTRFNSALPREIVTLPELLREHGGYYTGICRRSYHLDGPGGRLGPVSKQVYDDNKLVTFQDRVDFLDKNSPRAKTKEIVNQFFDGRPEGKPWFLWVNFNDPHHAWDADAISPPYDPAKIEVPGFLPDLPGVRGDLARYCGEVARMDEEFQWVLDIAAQRGDANNTLVVFAGDNGMALPHGKGSLYDPGLNVPLLVRWPGKVANGQVVDDLISMEDFAPTCLEAAGLEAPASMTGRSFLARITGGDYQPRDYIFAERGVHGSATFNESTKSSGYDLSRCSRSGRFKYIYNCTPWIEYVPVDSQRDPGWQDMLRAHQAGGLSKGHEQTYFKSPRPIVELYDLQDDPHELNNLAGQQQYAEVERELRHALIEKMIVDQDYLPLPAE